MKRLLLMVIMLMCCIGLYAQTKKTLTGTWQTKGSQFRKYMSFTPTHFTVMEVDSVSGIIKSSTFGSYKFDNGIYTEKILHTSNDSAGMIGLTTTLTLTIQSEDKMHISGSLNGMEISQLWTRVPVMDINLNIRKVPLYVLKNGAKQIILNIAQDAKSPLSIIQQDYIDSLEVLKDKSATDLYQDKGKYGVILITVKDSNLDEVIKDLTDKGYIL